MESLQRWKDVGLGRGDTMKRESITDGKPMAGGAGSERDGAGGKWC